MAPRRPAVDAPATREAGEAHSRAGVSALWPDGVSVLHPGSFGPDGSAIASLASATSALLSTAVARLPREAAALLPQRMVLLGHTGNATSALLLGGGAAGDHGGGDDGVVWSWGGIKVGNLEEEHGRPSEFTLMQASDIDSWVVFIVVFATLIAFDNFVLHRSYKPISFARASCYTVFWLLCAVAFGVYVAYARSLEDAFDWGTGYLLEWMLSVDNLFVFRTIFLAFKTPDTQRHKPLFWGIIGAVVFRMIFFAVGEILLHVFWWMAYVLGGFLVYTGVKLLLYDEEEEDVEDNVVLKKFTAMFPFVNKYSATPRFFDRIYDSDPGSPRQLDESPPASMSGIREHSTPEDVENASAGGESEGSEQQPPLRATRLAMVVVVLEVTDIVFAVDSVSAIVAQIPDLFLAYTACVFAMLGLRATFFVVDELANMFALLNYAVSAMLVFIGLKLILKPWVHIPPELVCGFLVAVIVLSIAASMLKDRLEGGVKQADEEHEHVQEAHPPELPIEPTVRSSPEDTGTPSALS